MELPRSRLFALLPLALIAAMVGLGLLIEAVRFGPAGTALWPTKLPVALLLAWAFVRSARQAPA